MGHRYGCTFGPGLYRIVLVDGGRRFVQSEAQVEAVRRLLPPGSMLKVQRDGYCLDQDDLESPDIIDGERFLNLPREQAMAELGVDSEADYTRAYRAVEEAVLARDRAVAAGARDRPSIVIKRKGRRVLDLEA
jgi:hypothetical protein